MRAAGSNPRGAPTLGIEIDKNGGELEAGDYTTLVWEPSKGGAAVTADVQQSYTPSDTESGEGGWRSTRDKSDLGTENEVGFNTDTANFDDVKNAAGLADATVLRIGISQGSGTGGITSAVDLLSINDTTYDFEQTAPPLPTAEGPANLAVKVAAPPFSDPGTDIPVEVTVTNEGPNPSGPTTATAITPGYTVGDADGGTINDNGTVTLDVPYLAPEASQTFTLTTDSSDGFRLGFAGAFVAPAADQPDPNFFNNIGLALAVTR